ncbi:MAG: anti-sigma factor C-terminal domain-containing protein [Streptococcaceae bacterium]|jgi:hypothetical protein|nr:anti-sigma factor C-terminal domain-containing protein [Streptococcaceae bacterium]
MELLNLSVPYIALFIVYVLLTGLAWLTLKLLKRKMIKRNRKSVLLWLTSAVVFVVGLTFLDANYSYFARVVFFFGAYLVLSAVIYGLFKLIEKLVSARRDTGDLLSNFQQLAKRTKAKRWALTAWLTGAVMVLFASTAVAINSYLMEKSFFYTSDMASNFLSTQAPNVSSNNLIVNEYGTFSSNLHADAKKNLDGYLVDWQDYDWNFGTISRGGYPYQYASAPYHDNARYTQGTNQKIASFFATDVNYHSENYAGLQLTHEAKTLSALPNHLAEVAVTFDKPYSYAEIQKMMPSNLMLNWYWIGWSDPKNEKAVMSGDYFGLESDYDTDNPSGKLSADSYSSFVANVKAAQKFRSTTINSFSPENDALKQVESYPTLETAKFSGLIVSGRTENLAKLDSEKWVFATNVGITTEVVPYQTPVK